MGVRSPCPIMGPNHKTQERERAAARDAEDAKRAEAERKAAVVEIWNARQADGRALWFYPTMGAAIAAGFSHAPKHRIMRAVALRPHCSRNFAGALRGGPCRRITSLEQF